MNIIEKLGIDLPAVTTMVDEYNQYLIQYTVKMQELLGDKLPSVVINNLTDDELAELVALLPPDMFYRNELKFMLKIRKERQQNEYKLGI
jgi:hypothetical protein